MKILVSVSFSFCLLLLTAITATAQYGLVCGNPKDKGCAPTYEFKPYDLGFLTGRGKLGTGEMLESHEVYAVILESVKAASNRNRQGCEFISEAKRMAAQKLFPMNKVFASRDACVGNVVWYSGVNREFNFLAVYAGNTEAEAQKLLEKAQRSYPQANLRKVKVVLDFSDQ